LPVDRLTSRNLAAAIRALLHPETARAARAARAAIAREDGLSEVVASIFRHLPRRIDPSGGGGCEDDGPLAAGAEGGGGDNLCDPLPFWLPRDRWAPACRLAASAAAAPATALAPAAAAAPAVLPLAPLHGRHCSAASAAELAEANRALHDGLAGSGGHRRPGKGAGQAPPPEPAAAKGGGGVWAALRRALAR
jgi:hypothetical protein